MEFLEKPQKKKKTRGTVPAGPEQLRGSRPSQRAGPAEPVHSARARPPISNLTAGARRSERERGAGTRERMTGGARMSSLTHGQGVAVLTGDDEGHGELRRVRGWLQETAARRWVVDLAGEGAWFASDEELQRRSFGWRWLWPFPAAKGAGERGETVSERRRFQIEEEERRRGPVPRDQRRPQAGSPWPGWRRAPPRPRTRTTLRTSPPSPTVPNICAPLLSLGDMQGSRGSSA